MKVFQRKKEDFVCINCEERVIGDGYTDHCPRCLYSVHVDVNPGDRRAECRGVMVPVGAKSKDSGYVIYYQCMECEHFYRVKSSAQDNIEKLIEISSNFIENDR